MSDMKRRIKGNSMQDLKSISEIFTQRIFRIPDYQRGYSWTSKQLREFWEDVNNLPTNRSHYMGMLTLKEVGEDVWEKWNDELWLIKDRKYRPFHVVDGQQRLTTTVIFIHVIYEFIKRLKQDSNSAIADIYLGSFSLKDIIEQYLFIQKPPEKILTSYKFGYETDNPSFQYLRYRIFEERDAGGFEIRIDAEDGPVGEGPPVAVRVSSVAGLGLFAKRRLTRTRAW